MELVMGFRDNIQKRSALTKTVACLLIVISALALFSTFSSTFSSPNMVPTGGKAWFTTDDGTTFFSDARSQVPPFQRDGKTVYGCEIVSGDGGKTKTVSYLFRYTPEVRDKVRDIIVNGVGGDPRFQVSTVMGQWEEIDLAGGKEVKLPNSGSAVWVKTSSPQGAEILAKDAKNKKLSVAP
jgi:hypothetical protein